MATIKPFSVLKEVDIEYTNRTSPEVLPMERPMRDSLDYARMVLADNTILAAKVEKITAEREAAIKALEEIMLQGGANTDTCSYCGNENCYQRAGHEVCNPVWTGARHFSKLHNCGECDQRWICEIEEKDCDRLYHSTDISEKKEV